MNGKTLIYCKLIFLTVFFSSCGIDSKNKSVKDDLISTTIDTLSQTEIQPQEAVNEESFYENESKKDKLKRIKENTKRIDLIKEWSAINKRALTETAKGGAAEYYYLYGQLEKIVTHQFDKTFQLFTEYYLLNGQLSFVSEKIQIYNCSYTMSEDSLNWIENKDLIVSDTEYSKFRYYKDYFEKGELIDQVTLDHCTYSPFDSEWLMARYKRRQTDFDELIKLVKKK
jgi:hypothetical protein